MGKDNPQTIPSLVIHKLSQAQYDREKEAGRLDPNAIYLTPEEAMVLETEISQDSTDEQVPSAKAVYDSETRSKEYAAQAISEATSNLDAKIAQTGAAADEKIAIIEQNLVAQNNEIEVVKGDLTSHASSSNSQFALVREEFATQDSEILKTAKEYSDANKSAAVSEAKAYTDSEIEKLVTDTEFEGVLSTIQEIQNAMATDEELAQALETAAGTKVDKGAVGSSTQPIYFDDNGAQPIAYKIEKSVPADAKFTDTLYTIQKDSTQKKIELLANGVKVAEVDDNNTTYDLASIDNSGLMSKDDKTKLDGIEVGANAYTHPTTSGNKHIPSGGSEGQILTYSADGTAQWSEPPSTEIDGLTATVEELNYTSGLTRNIQEQLDEFEQLKEIFFLGTRVLILNLDPEITEFTSSTVNILNYDALIFPNTITSLADQALRQSPAEKIKLSNQLESIGQQTFDSAAIKELTFPSSLKEIGWYAFQYSKLTSISIPGTVTWIGPYAFKDCQSLESVILEKGLTFVSSYCFQYCSKIKTVIISDTITTIGTNAFSGCSAITDVYYTGTEEQWNAIGIAEGNDYLKNATIHYNYTGE